MGGCLKIVVLSAALLLSGARAGADLVSHNGTGSNGSGDVQVDLTFGNATGDVKILKVFSEIATHDLSYEYDNGEPEVAWNETIVNTTGVAWSDYNLTLFGADFFGMYANGDVASTKIGDLARETNPVQTTPGMGTILFGGDGTVASSMIVRDDEAETSSLWIFFDDPIAAGESFDLFFYVDDVGMRNEGFRLTQTPSPVPLPGGALLAMLGFGMISRIKRRLA